MFGIVPPDVLPSVDPDPSDAPLAPDPILAIVDEDREPRPDDDLEEGGPSDVDGDDPPPPPIDYTRDANGYINLFAARSLIGPVGANNVSPVTAPNDPTVVIGLLKWPHGVGAEVWIAECRCTDHRKCSRMRSKGHAEYADYPSLLC